MRGGPLLLPILDGQGKPVGLFLELDALQDDSEIVLVMLS